MTKAGKRARNSHCWEFLRTTTCSSASCMCTTCAVRTQTLTGPLRAKREEKKSPLNVSVQEQVAHLLTTSHPDYVSLKGPFSTFGLLLMGDGED